MDIQHGGFTWRPSPNGGWWFWDGNEWITWRADANHPQPPPSGTPPTAPQTIQVNTGCGKAVIVGIVALLLFVVAFLGFCAYISAQSP